MSARKRFFDGGFTLVEMIVVIAIIVVLSTLVVPALSSLVMAQGVTGGTYDVAGFLESARNEAMTRQTYVWVGFTMEAHDGSIDMVEGAVYSRDGSGTNTSATNLAPLGKTTRMHNVALASWDKLKPGTQNLLKKDPQDPLPAPTPSSVASNTGGISFQVGGSSFNKTTLTFTPRGEAMLKGSVGSDDGFDPCIDVSFQQAHGGVAKPGANDAAAIVQGSTGTVRILRL